MSISITNNSKQVLAAFNMQLIAGLEECGLIAEGYAKDNLTQSGAVDTGFLRNSVTHQVAPDQGVCYVGTNIEYAPYIEFGTGKYYNGGRRTPWFFQDRDGAWHKTEGMEARPYLRPAVADHGDQWQKVIKKHLKG